MASGSALAAAIRAPAKVNGHEVGWNGFALSAWPSCVRQAAVGFLLPSECPAYSSDGPSTKLRWSFDGLAGKPGNLRGKIELASKAAGRVPLRRKENSLYLGDDGVSPVRATPSPHFSAFSTRRTLTLPLLPKRAAKPDPVRGWPGRAGADRSGPSHSSQGMATRRPAAPI